MTREDFIFTIGYQGETAIVDGTAKRRYARATTKDLVEAGLFKAALCSALYSGNEAELEAVLEGYRRASGRPSMTLDQLKRTLGVFGVAENIVKAKVI